MTNFTPTEIENVINLVFFDDWAHAGVILQIEYLWQNRNTRSLICVLGICTRLTPICYLGCASVADWSQPWADASDTDYWIGCFYFVTDSINLVNNTCICPIVKRSRLYTIIESYVGDLQLWWMLPNYKLLLIFIWKSLGIQWSLIIK